MTKEYEIIEDGGRIQVYTPYNPEFVTRIKAAGGKWNGYDKAWELDARSIETAREIMREVYGRDDKPQKLVTVRVHLEESIYEDCGPVVLFGKAVASAFGRDTGARVADGVCFQQGEAISSGSRKNWETRIVKDSKFIMYDVPAQAVENKLNWRDGYGTYEVVEAEDPNEALREERKQLLERIAEIDDILSA